MRHAEHRSYVDATPQRPFDVVRQAPPSVFLVPLPPYPTLSATRSAVAQGPRGMGPHVRCRRRSQRWCRLAEIVDRHGID